MDSENEVRPLLHSSFERQSWRSKARKRCMKVPSEITITGIILGLFLVVVTLLIVLENMEAEKKDDISLGNNLLGSPFKYNKKAEDYSWQTKKENMKMKKTQQDLNQKWDNVNKGWKKFPDISGKISNNKGIRFKMLKETVETSDLPEVTDKYGKETDSLEMFLNLQESDTNLMKQFNKDATEIKDLLHSGIKWKDIDDGWKALSAQGWKESRIREALFKALKERREEIREAEGFLQSPIKLGDMWDKINDSWKKNINEGNKDIGYQKIKVNKEAEKQKNINDEWKDKMNILQSPKSSIKKFVKADGGWQKLGDQGWKNKDIEEALIEAWKEKDNDRDVLQSPVKVPLNIQSIWGKLTGFFKSLVQKGMDKQNSQKEINDEWANKFGYSLQSPQMSYKKWKKIDELRKKHSKDDQKDENSDETENEDIQPQQSTMNLKDFEDIIEAIKEYEKGQKEINDEYAKDFNNILQSSKKTKKIDELRKKHSKDDWKDKTSDKTDSENDSPEQSPVNFEDLEDIIKFIKEHQKDMKDKGSDKAEKENEQPLQSPTKFDDFMEKIAEFIKDHQKGNKEAEKQKGINDEWKKNMQLLSSSKQTDKKWKQVDDHWKTLIEHGWKDKDIKEAVYKAWKDGDKLLQSAMGHNNMKWKKVNDGWKKISNKSITMPTRCPISKPHRELLLGSSMSAPPINCALITEGVRREFGKCIDMSFLPKECKPSWRVKCFSTYKYRKLDGTCNNKIHPTWGKSGTPFVRMIAPDYADGVSALRVAKDGGPLPNPRQLSITLYSKRTKPDIDTSVLFMYFGLLVDHDMVETAVNSDSIPCCEDDFIAHPQTRPKECLQIDIPSDDPFYGPKNVRCLSLVRSIPVNGECGGRREQLNKATSFLDGSVVYGSAVNQAKQLRTFSRGQLRTQLINNTPFMAYSEGAGYSCGPKNEPLKCFEAGDSRVNMMVELTAMHTLWYREHNRIATELHKMNPVWRDELIFQEARRILIAELQHITYNEFLPLLLGEQAMEDYDIKIDESKIYDGYDETVDPSVFNVFGAAAFRFGHSLVPDMQYLLGPNNSTQGKVPLHETFFNAKLLYHNGLDLLLRGAATQRTQSVDSYITPEVREHLFQPEDLDYGYDLAAVGIQRGRDQGLPAYTKWRSVCGLSEVKTWDDLYAIMDKDRADAFKSVYQSVDDIDLIPGALAEHHEKGSLVGPTYTCLIGRQFKKTRKGDRYWFETQNEMGSFTRDQLDEIYKSNMARIICDNSDDIKEIQRNPLKVPSSHNVLLDCDAIPKVDLSKWKSNF